MKKLFAGIVLAGMMVSAGVAMADDSQMTIQKLFEACNSPPGSLGSSLCLGYVSGASDFMSLTGQARKLLSPQGASVVKSLSLCGTSTVTHGAEVQAFKNWAQAHPEYWTMAAQIGVAAALHEKWGCP